MDKRKLLNQWKPRPEPEKEEPQGPIEVKIANSVEVSNPLDLKEPAWLGKIWPVRVFDFLSDQFAAIKSNLFTVTIQGPVEIKREARRAG